ncbi:iron-siderophore ABC transporter substrate-binding protein [Rhodococcus sp. NPDC049939]|uniref:iron-siderophore ABC transporter substrate-binding protein n=1 Tax=Rhodococcus sp. NPDC049939 TaxID=3155511 RepID=UPI0033EF0DB9
MSLATVSTARRAFAGLVAVTAVVLASCSQPSDDDASTIIRTTTKIEGAGVVGIDRDTTAACALPTPVDPGLAPDGTHHVVHTAGESDVPSDPQRIVVLDTPALDAVCSLGLWERVVGAAVDDGETSQPTYLGTGISHIASIGSEDDPNLDLVAQANPDLILGSSPTGDDSYAEFSAVAPTVYVGSDPVNWKTQFLLAGNALGRADSASAQLEQYQQDAALLGYDIDSSQTQASVVRFDSDSLHIQGPSSFAGQVLADAGVRRPAYQDLGESVTAAVPDDDLEQVEGDLVYVIIDDMSKAHAEDVMASDAWQNLGAAEDGRVFVVADAIWTGNGLVAAHAVLTDLRDTLNAYVS